MANFLLNGEAVARDSVTLHELLSEKGLLTSKIAVEVDRRIVPRSDYESFYLADGMEVEVVHFIGGG